MMNEIDTKIDVAKRKEELKRGAKIEVMDKMLRPASANGARSLRSFQSKYSSARGNYSVAGSAMSQIPDLDPAVLLNMAWEVFGLRTKLVAYAKKNQIGLREILNSTKLLKMLASLGYPLKIGNLKALLKELGFNWNGASCSLT
jgi:hypothetical protein